MAQDFNPPLHCRLSQSFSCYTNHKNPSVYLSTPSLFYLRLRVLSPSPVDLSLKMIQSVVHQILFCKLFSCSFKKPTHIRWSFSLKSFYSVIFHIRKLPLENSIAICLFQAVYLIHSNTFGLSMIFSLIFQILVRLLSAYNFLHFPEQVYLFCSLSIFSTTQDHKV